MADLIDRDVVLAILNKLLSQAEDVIAEAGESPAAQEALVWAISEVSEAPQVNVLQESSHCFEVEMKKKEVTFEYLVDFIHSAIESEQGEPREFSLETEKRLALVYRQLRAALNLPLPEDC